MIYGDHQQYPIDGNVPVGDANVIANRRWNIASMDEGITLLLGNGL